MGMRWCSGQLAGLCAAAGLLCLAGCPAGKPTKTGAIGSGASDIAFTSLFRHGNFDTVNNGVIWDPATSSHALPNSLYLGAKPGWWPAATPWPWAGPDLSPMVGTLPAKQRSDAMGL